MSKIQAVLKRAVSVDTSENVGMSSVSEVRTFATENLRFPTEGQSASG